jgi:hypothetical protein
MGTKQNKPDLERQISNFFLCDSRPKKVKDMITKIDRLGVVISRSGEGKRRGWKK